MTQKDLIQKVADKQIKLAKERYQKDNPDYNPNKIVCYNCKTELKEYAEKEPRIAYTAYVCKKCLDELVIKINRIKKGDELDTPDGWNIKHVDADKGYRFVATKRYNSQWFDAPERMAAHILMSWR